MGLLDNLTGALGGGAQSGSGLSGLLGQAFNAAGGMQGVLNMLNNAGYGEKVNSWLGQGANSPITADEISNALGNQQLQKIASSLGLPLDQVANAVAQNLPTAVDQASPNGKLQS